MARLAAIALACASAWMAGCGGEKGPAGGSDGAGLLDGLRERVAALTAEGLEAPGGEAVKRVPGPSYEIVRVLPGSDVALRSKPGGPVAVKLDDKTEFGSERWFWVAKRKPGWLGVPAAALPNGELGWIEDDPAVLQRFQTPYAVRVDLSSRRMVLRYGKRVLEDFEVGVGGAGTPTPPGAYSVTDGLVGKAVGRYYGCCVLALTGHQPSLPPDWIGGDRIAIHGTPDGSGAGSSSGCLRASDREMVSLFTRVPLGAPVFISP